ncbi:hypothetical protein [Sphingomonas sp. T9W2]|uniref:thermonuclease family protein n=1 Tax=Sphingomonas sp. T9W2 TaxID=3143183 RepID=UPI0031F54995
MIDQPPAFTCTVVRVHDGDGPLWCREGPKVRIAGVQSPDFASAAPCRARRPGYTCSDVKARASRRIVERLTLRKVMRCQPVDRSYSRVVARCTLPDGRSLSCATIAAGAAVRWDRYWRRYRMGGCV